MIPVVFTSKIHDSYKNFLLDSWFTKTFHHLFTKWFLSGNLVSFCCVSLVFKLLFHPDSVSSFVFVQVWSFFVTALSTRLTSGLSARNAWVIQGVRGHAPPEKCLKIGPSEMPYPAFTGSNAINSYCILLSFSQSLITHDSRAEVQRFMIPKFLKPKFMIITCFVIVIHDSWFRFHPRLY